MHTDILPWKCSFPCIFKNYLPQMISIKWGIVFEWYLDQWNTIKEFWLLNQCSMSNTRTYFKHFIYPQIFTLQLRPYSLGSFLQYVSHLSLLNKTTDSVTMMRLSFVPEHETGFLWSIDDCSPVTLCDGEGAKAAWVAHSETETSYKLLIRSPR